MCQITCFRQKNKNTKTTKQKVKHKNPCRSRELNPGHLARNAAPPSQLRLSIVDKLFNCFDAMGRKVNNQSRICGPAIFNKVIFCNILHAWITILGSFSYLREYDSLLKYG